MADDSERSRELASLLKRRGVVFPAFEIHGGVAGLFDYGPVGGRLLRKVQQRWREYWLSKGNIVEIDSPTVTPSAVLEASGHVGAFNDYASECNKCGAVFRSDHLVEDFHPSPDSLPGDQLDGLLEQHTIACPSCDEASWKPSRPMNLMFSTMIGAVGGGRQAYLRPETAQGMFVTFPSLLRHFRDRLPFGAVQIGKGYRNEISPRQGMIRQREFNMAELEYFIDPESSKEEDFSPWQGISVALVPDPQGEPHAEVIMGFEEALGKGVIRNATVARFMAETLTLVLSLGADPSKIRFRQHEADEMAHYATDCWDLEMFGSYGWVECVGIAHRGCYDLSAHEPATSGTSMRVWKEFDEPRVIDKMAVTPVHSQVGPAFKKQAGAVKDALDSLHEVPEQFPFELHLADGTTVTITSEMVEVKRVQKTTNGEWVLPHVVEPAFGLDRIIWHLIDHAYQKTNKDGDEYVVLSLAESVAPYDAVVLPLFEKDGMSEMATDIQKTILGHAGLAAYYDGSRSIGRRYARADEIGVPWAITVDHQSLEDGTVTVRRRDDQIQIRLSSKDVVHHLRSGTLGAAFQ